MATGAASSNDPRASTDGAGQDAAQRERYIYRRIDWTRRYVQLRDLITSFMQGAAVTIAFLLALTVWDHWVAPLALWSRAAALLVILAFWVYVAVTQFAPLVFRRINPVYAARTIEDGVPGLKNSLTNYLLLRSQRAGVRSVVYEAVGQQAANDLSQVNVETAVDRSRLVRIGYVFAALVVFGGLYSLLSPKDLWQTVRRVTTPWADIARPSRVNIEDVRVNDVVCDGRDPVYIYLGQSARVSVVVRGLDPDQSVVLHYSTADQQTINRPIMMHATVSGSRYEAEVPEDEAGLQQDIVFRIEADDAITRNYTLKVLAAPHIVIDSIAYVYPAYTRLEPRVTRDRGDIRGVEGTRVTITASANQEIAGAYIHFGEIDETDSTVGTVASSNYVRMRPAGKMATASFQLSLPAGRRRSQRRSYEVRFTNGSGQKNDRPVQHLLEVIPDLAPEIEILTPAQQEIKLPADREQIIELLARDPDFGLASVQLKMVAGGEPILKQMLLDDPGGWTGNVNRRFRFVPREYGLQPGHLVTYWGTAQDNLTAGATGRSEPNTTSTSKYRFQIVASKRPNGASESTRNSDPQGTENDSSEEANEGDPAQPTQNESRDPDRPPVDQNGEAAGESAEEQRGQEPIDDAPPGNNGSQTPGGAEGDLGEKGDGSGSGDGSARGNQPDSSGDGGPNGGGADRRATDGRDDGEIFEDVLERMRQSGEASESATPTDDRSANVEPDAGGQVKTTTLDDGVGADDPQSANDWNRTQHDGDGQRESSASKTREDRKQGDGDDADATPGEGGQTGGIAQPETQPATDAEQGDADKQPQAELGDNGESGAGEKSPDEQRAPASQEANRQQSKQMRSGKGDADDSPQKAKSPSSSEPQSDSEEGESGNRSGDGKGGSGQGAQQLGNDSAGSSSAADDGAGTADESGDGETSSRAGDDVEVSGETESPGDHRGSDATSGQSSSPSDPPDGATSPDKNDGPSESGHQPTGGSKSQGQKSTGKLPTTGGRPGHADQQPAETQPGRKPGEDAPNLKYANEATDMALRYLKDQQDNPDRALLNDLGWSDDELRRFIERWDQLKQGSSRDAALRKELHERLESLGLQPPHRRTRSGSTQRDLRGGLTDSANRSSPPPEYLDQVRAYQQSIAEGRE